MNNSELKKIAEGLIETTELAGAKSIELQKKGLKIITTEKDYLRINPLKRRRFGFVSINVDIENEDNLITEVSKIFK